MMNDHGPGSGRLDSIDQLILRVRDRLDVTTVVVTHDMRSAGGWSAHLNAA